MRITDAAWIEEKKKKGPDDTAGGNCSPCMTCCSIVVRLMAISRTCLGRFHYSELHQSSILEPMGFNWSQLRNDSGPYIDRVDENKGVCVSTLLLSLATLTLDSGQGKNTKLELALELEHRSQS